MAITDTFALVFETDGVNATVKELKRIDDAASGVSKSQEGSAKSSQKAEKGIMGLKKEVMKALAPLAAFGVVVNRTINFAKQGEGLLFMANSAAVAAESFTALAMAAERIGGSREGMAGSLASLSSGLMGIRRGEENGITQAAMYYGVRFYGPNGLASPEEMLENIARAMEGKSVAEQMDMGRMLGLDEGTIRLLQRGVAGLRKEMELAQKYNPFDEKALKDIQDFQYLLRELKAAFGMLVGQLARDLLPNFKAWGEVARDALDYLIEHTDEVKVALGGLALATLAALGPWFLIGGVLALLLDDFITFAKGGESALEPLWKVVMAIKDGLVSIGEWIDAHPLAKKVYGAAKDALNPFSGLKNVGPLMQTGKDLLGKLPSAGFMMSGFTSGLMQPLFNNQIDITVNESGDPNKTQQAVGNGLKNAGILDAAWNLTTAQTN